MRQGFKRRFKRIRKLVRRKKGRMHDLQLERLQRRGAHARRRSVQHESLLSSKPRRRRERCSKLRRKGRPN